MRSTDHNFERFSSTLVQIFPTEISLVSKESNNIYPRFGGFSKNFGFRGLREFLIPLFSLQYGIAS